MWYNQDDPSKVLCNRCHSGNAGAKSKGVLKPWKSADVRRKQLSDRHKGRKLSEEHRKKISEATSGSKNPHFGKKASPETIEKLRKSHLGQQAWNKGKRYKSRPLTRDEHSAALHKLVKARKMKAHNEANGIKYGHTEDAKKRIALGKLGEKNPSYGKQPWMKKLSDEEFTMYQEQMRQNRLQQVFPRKDTDIEVMMQNALTEKGIAFVKHPAMMGQPDIFIESKKLCIFCDGDYYHANPNPNRRKKNGFQPDDIVINRNKVAAKVWEYDAKITSILQSQGYTVLRFWESDIKKDLSVCIERIIALFV